MPISLTAPDSFRRLAAPLGAVVRAVLAQEERRAGEIAIVLAGDRELRELNRAWRRIDRATDVISFAYDEHEPDAATRPVGGDLVISMARVAEQARRFRVTPGSELARLVVHGVLHLCGHDHVHAGERALMRLREDKALRAVKAAVKRLDAALPEAATPAVAKRTPAKRTAKKRPPAKRAAKTRAPARRAKKKGTTKRR